MGKISQQDRSDGPAVSSRVRDSQMTRPVELENGLPVEASSCCGRTGFLFSLPPELRKPVVAAMKLNAPGFTGRVDLGLFLIFRADRIGWVQ